MNGKIKMAVAATLVLGVLSLALFATPALAYDNETDNGDRDQDQTRLRTRDRTCDCDMQRTRDRDCNCTGDCIGTQNRERAQIGTMFCNCQKSLGQLRNQYTQRTNNPQPLRAHETCRLLFFPSTVWNTALCCLI